MRWVLWISFFLGLLLGIYFASPFIALHRIATAVETRDAVAVTERIDFPAVRRSLTKQIVATYLKLTGKKLPLGAIGKRFAFSVADPIVARLMTVTALLDLLAEGRRRKQCEGTNRQGTLQFGFPKEHLAALVELPPMGKKFLCLPTAGWARNEQFRVHLRLSRWRWKFVGVDLPESMKEQLARELVELTRERIRAPN